MSTPQPPEEVGSELALGADDDGGGQEVKEEPEELAPPTTEEAPPTTEEAQKASALLKANTYDAAPAAAAAASVWGPEGVPKPSGRRALFDVGGLGAGTGMAPLRGYGLRWSADNRVAAVCGDAIYAQALGVSRMEGGVPSMTFLKERVYVAATKTNPGNEHERPEFDVGDTELFEAGMSAGRKFQLLPVSVNRRSGKSQQVSGTMVQGNPIFRGMEWSPPMPASGGECLMVTCSSDHRLGVYCAPTGFGRSWREIACLSDTLEEELKKLKYKPQAAVFQGSSAGAAAPSSAPASADESSGDECLSKKALLSNLSVAWSQRTSYSAGTGVGKLSSWLAVGGVGSLAVFVHSTRAAKLDENMNGLTAEPAHAFHCAGLVALPESATYVTALAWLDEGPAPSAAVSTESIRLLVSGTGNGTVMLWQTAGVGAGRLDHETKGTCKLTPLRVIGKTDNSPVLSLIPAPWITPSGSGASARLAVAKGTGVWIWEHGSDPWFEGEGETQGKKRRKGADGTATTATGDGSIGQTYLLPKVGPSIISGAAWARDFKSTATERHERVMLTVSNVEAHMYGYEGPWPGASGAAAAAAPAASRLVPSAAFDEQPANAASVWGVAASPNALTVAVLAQNPIAANAATAEAMFINHKAHVSFSLRPSLTDDHVFEMCEAKLQREPERAPHILSGRAPAPQGLTPMELWELAEYCIASATEPADLLTTASKGVGKSRDEVLQKKIRRALARAVYERRLSTTQHSISHAGEAKQAYTPAPFVGHRPSETPPTAMFTQHELTTRRALVEQTMGALAAHVVANDR